MNTRTKRRNKKVLVGTLAVAMSGALATSGGILAYANSRFYTDFTSLDNAMEYSREINVEIMEEGMVLLKNDNNALPLKNGNKITLFGNTSYEPYWGETGSGNGKTDYMYLTESLEKAGLKVNPKVWSAYESLGAAYTTTMNGGLKFAVREEAPLSILTAAKNSYTLYGDAAITTISRMAGENYTFATPDADQYGVLPDYFGEDADTSHMLMLTATEKAVIEEMKANFDKVIVLINCPTVMEIPELAADDGVDSILWIGQPGQYGLEAVGNVLNGSVSPSGRTVDTWISDMLNNDPAYVNVATYEDLLLSVTKGTDKEGNVTFNESTASSTYYDEGIYLGYKYYETAYAEAEAGNYEGFVYDDVVVYPFGYGLSYTSFSQTLVTDEVDLSTVTNLEDIIEVQVEVENTGKVAGKEVVQIYNHAPYTKGEIEKSEVNLVGFAKTDTLDPGETQTVTVEIRVADLLSFDYTDANNNLWYGYELEEGDYELRLQENAHTIVKSDNIEQVLKFNVEETIYFDNEGPVASHSTDVADKTNLVFSNGDEYDSLLIKELGGEFNEFSRADFAGTYPQEKGVVGTYDKDATTTSIPVSSDLEGYDDLVAYFTDGGTRYTGYYTPDMDQTTDPWYYSVDDVRALGWTQAADNVIDRTNGKTAIQLKDMIGIDYLDEVTEVTINGTKYSSGRDAWVAFMNQLTWEEMANFIRNGQFETLALEAVGKLPGSDRDGPEQLSDDGSFWACAAINAATFNKELNYQRGVAIGNEGLYLGVTGWYGPGINLHHSQFYGRNNIYYSEDGFISGIIASSAVAGAQSRGLTCYIKHFVCSELKSGSGALWVSEQALRENYFKPFEYSVKAGNATSVMSAMNRIGVMYCYGNSALLNTVLRGEWGFRGSVVTDTYSTEKGKCNYIQRGGSDTPLGNYDALDSTSMNRVFGTWDAEKNMLTYTYTDTDGNSKTIDAPTQWAAIRNSAMHVLWMAANTSIAQNGIDTTLFTGDTFEIVAGEAFSVNIAVDEEVYGTGAEYSIVAGELPEGLTLDVAGNITGSPKLAGTYTVTIRQAGDGWVNSDAEFTFIVESFLNSSAGWTATAGQEFTTVISHDSLYFDPDADLSVVGAIQSLNYTLLTDIPGLTMSADGTLTGTLAEGTYEITIRLSYYYTDKWFANTEAPSDKPMDYVTPNGNWGWARQSDLVVIDTSYVLTVSNGSESGAAGADGVGIQSIEKTDTDGLVDTYTITMTDGSTYTFTVTNGANGVDGTDGTDGANGTNGVDGKDGKDGSGCGSAVSAGSAAVALAIVFVGVAGVIAVRRKKNQD